MPRLWLAPVLALLAFARPALAHPLDNARLEVDVDDGAAAVAWHIAARALAAPLALERDARGGLTAAALSRVAAYAHTRIELSTERGVCALDDGITTVEDTQLAVRLHGRCPDGAEALTVRYDAYFELDDAHRSFLRLRDGTHTETVTLTAARRVHAHALRDGGALVRTVRDYVVEGVLHIWLGFDHLLFLLTLLLPIALADAQAARPRAAWREVVQVISAFTLAHSLTLALAALGLVRLPERLVESVIALSVILAAAHNLRPIFRGRAAWLAFGFGLVHGFGFASALSELGLPRAHFALALVAFNVGVELGQLAVVALAWPIARRARDRASARPVARVGSVLVMGIAAVWLAERALDVQILGGADDVSAAAVVVAPSAAEADLALREGRLDDARARYREALSWSEQQGDVDAIALQHHNLAAVARAAGDGTSAAQALRHAVAVRERVGAHADAVRDRLELARLYRRTGQLDDALDVTRPAVDAAERLALRTERADAEAQLALVQQQRGALDEAHVAYARAIALYEADGRTRELANTLANAAWVARARGAEHEARQHYARALALFEQLGSAGDAARVRDLLGAR
ncbi:MAG: HupE/UreJ family protein [Polyangiales bacterium]